MNFSPLLHGSPKTRLRGARDQRFPGSRHPGSVRSCIPRSLATSPPSSSFLLWPPSLSPPRPWPTATSPKPAVPQSGGERVRRRGPAACSCPCSPPHSRLRSTRCWIHSPQTLLQAAGLPHLVPTDPTGYLSGLAVPEQWQATHRGCQGADGWPTKDRAEELPAAGTSAPKGHRL